MGARTLTLRISADPSASSNFYTIKMEAEAEHIEEKPSYFICVNFPPNSKTSQTTMPSFCDRSIGVEDCFSRWTFSIVSTQSPPEGELGVASQVTHEVSNTSLIPLQILSGESWVGFGAQAAEAADFVILDCVE